MRFLQSSVVALVSLQLCAVQASPGDRNPAYQYCVQDCIESGKCHPIRWDLRLFKWDCEDCCRYDCMMSIEYNSSPITVAASKSNQAAAVNSNTDDRREKTSITQQYHGKWPFQRLSGIQEPASVLFSLMNWYAHFILYRRVYLPAAMSPSTKRSISTNQRHPWQSFIWLNSLVQQNAWLWSTVFHCRDVSWTERMDYLGAMLALLSGCWLAIHRVCRLDKRPRWVVAILTLVAVMFFATHSLYLLSLERFDYGYNMIASVAVGLLQSFVWLVWCAWQYCSVGGGGSGGGGNRSHGRSRDYVGWCVAAVVSAMAAMSLELLDFPPLIRAIDAHALWHLSTVPITYLFYRFHREDALFMIATSAKPE